MVATGGFQFLVLKFWQEKLGFREVFDCPGRCVDPVGPDSFVFSVHRGLNQVGLTLFLTFVDSSVICLIFLVHFATLPPFFLSTVDRQNLHHFRCILDDLLYM